jgi:DNA-binding IclR family transcriptional regulator
VRSVWIAADLLKALAREGGSLPLKDLAAINGLARAKVHRYLTSLRRAGFVSQNSETGHYEIGFEAVSVGLTALRRLSPVAEVCGELPALRDQINQTVTAAVWSESGPIIVAMHESDHWITMNVRIGSRLPILTTAIGRTFLAHLPDASVVAQVASERRQAQLQRLTVPTADEIEALVREIRSRRLSRAPSALFPGIDAIAAPVFDYRDDLVAVVCVVARSEAKITGWNGSAVRALIELAERISARLGHSRDDVPSAKPNGKGLREREAGPVPAAQRRRST